MQRQQPLHFCDTVDGGPHLRLVSSDSGCCSFAALRLYYEVIAKETAL